MKRSALVISIFLYSIHFTLHAESTLRFASSATYPPFEFLDSNNQLAGYDIDLAKALCKKMQVPCSFHHQVFDGLIPSLQFRRYDVAISGIDITNERSKQVTFTQPYLQNSAILIAYKGEYNDISQLRGQRVGMVNGTTHQKFIKAHYPKIQIISYDSYQHAINDLKNKRLNAVFGDTAAVNEWLKTNPELDVIGQPIKDPIYFGTGLGMAVRKNNFVLRDKLNKALDEIKADGTYQKITNKWFPLISSAS